MTQQIDPSGVVMWGTCSIKTDKCTAREPEGAPITAVWMGPGRQQANICSACLAEKVRTGEWLVEGARVAEARR